MASRRAIKKALVRIYSRVVTHECFCSGVQSWFDHTHHDHYIPWRGTRRNLLELLKEAVPKVARVAVLDLEFGWKGRSNEGNDFGG